MVVQPPGVYPNLNGTDTALADFPNKFP